MRNKTLVIVNSKEKATGEKFASGLGCRVIRIQRTGSSSSVYFLPPVDNQRLSHGVLVVDYDRTLVSANRTNLGLLFLFLDDDAWSNHHHHIRGVTTDTDVFE